MFDNFLKNNIGQIIEISEPNFTGLERYNIKYDILCNMPREITYFFKEKDYLSPW